jgi:hypothetical protein
VFDRSGRVTSRKGYEELSSSTDYTSNAPTQMHIFEHNTGSTVITSGLDSATHRIYSGTSTLTDLTGTITAATASNWKFANFVDSSGNEKIIGMQTGHAMIVSDDGAAFADVVKSGGSEPPSGDALASCFGRLWGVDSDGLTVQYSALGDETEWNTGAGSFSTKDYWPGGLDHVVAIHPWEDKLIVFGQHNTLVYDGVDNVASDFVLWDTIAGNGCIARDSVQSIGSDVVFLSDSGLRSVRKTMVEGKVPLADFSQAVFSDINLLTSGATKTDIKSVYCQGEGFYILFFGQNNTSYMFNVQNLELSRSLPESQQVSVSKWTSMGVTCAAYSREEKLYLGVTDSSGNGQVAWYATYLDGSTTYTMSYASPWMDLSAEQQPGTWNKIVKKINVTVAGNSSYITTLGLSFNFNDVSSTYSRAVAANTDTVSEFEAASTNVGAEWGTTEWGARADRQEVARYNTRGYGQFIKVSFSVPVNGYKLSLQQIDLFMKKGRLTI